MIPLVTTRVMRECDARAVAERGVDSLVALAGTAVADHARRLLGSTYGRRIGVLVGPGLNGADGQFAASELRRRGAKVDVITVAHQPDELRGFDLVVDAAFGIGCSRSYIAPRVSHGTLVVAVDVPSGVDADSGALQGRPMPADVTVALGALKYAHVDGDAAAFTGEIRWVNLGISVPERDALIEDADLDMYVRRGVDDHKWTHALTVLAGSSSMSGAATLVCQGALGAGASMIRLASRGTISTATTLAPEVVRFRGSNVDPRSRCVVAGPGLGEDCAPWLNKRLASVASPVVLDADALAPEVVHIAAGREWVLTPHQGEFERLSGTRRSTQRIGLVRQLAAQTGCVVLLKGPTTLVASPHGDVRVVRSGTSALATAGSGDVLAGMIGAAIARGHDPLMAAALSAHLHGRVGALLPVYAGASALAPLISRILAK